MIICGDCLEEMKKMSDNSISAIVTDPPYGLHFMGKDWDSFKFKKDPGKGCGKKGRLHNGKAQAFDAGNYDTKRDDEFQEFIRNVSIEALRIVKPGGHILMFGSTRRHHRQMCGLEDAGWELRDVISWLYGSGFPKSHNHFGIEGYGTALKPAWEPIIVAMKPLEGTFKQNAEKWGQAGINIDGCRVGNGDDKGDWPKGHQRNKSILEESKGTFTVGREIPSTNFSKGRWPANLILDEEAGEMLDRQSGVSKSSDMENHETKIGGSVYGWATSKKHIRSGGHNDSGGASRFFYCAKASASERNEGLSGFSDKPSYMVENGSNTSGVNGERYDRTTTHKNNHPTVKPLKLMEYLITLIMPPKDGILLDPFAGSGTTILAARRLGFEAIGIEKSEEYCEIARARENSCLNFR